uniref:GRB10 interacting GYF protein 1 n=1 Tax=Myripristis murdjan TaxID=586833 RepID=A0A667XD18_9TELE
MTAETLNFGPEWLRALSSGGSVTSPPPSPAMPKYKLAEYRYGREEMLALYIKDNKVPEDMQDKEFAAILQDEPMQPLALVPLTEEEQRNFSMSVNSVAVLRLMGKGVGGATPAGVVRGRGATRGGRGRGRGEGGFYQRSIEDAEVGFGRSVREIHRSQSWDDRGERRFEKPLRREVGRPGFEESGGPGGPGRKEYTRADSDNWRTLREEQDEEEGEPGSSWRLAGPRRDGRRNAHSSMDGGPRSAGWRDHGGPGESRRRKFDFDFRDSDGHGGGRRRAGSEGLEDDRDGLPEWCTDEEDGEMGTFDSSGAFMPIKVYMFSPTLFNTLFTDPVVAAVFDLEPVGGSTALTQKHHPLNRDSINRAHCFTWCFFAVFLSDVAPAGGSKAQLSPSSAATSSSLPSPPPSSAAPLLPPSGGDTEDDEGMKHLQQEAEKMVASLQDTSLEEECFTQALQQQQESRNTAAALPLSHEAAMKWFYKDPQGEIQGPFTTVEMCEWFQAGYFTMTLLVKRGCDEGFQPLGDVIKMWGRVPFAPGPSPPPLLLTLKPYFKYNMYYAFHEFLYFFCIFFLKPCDLALCICSRCSEQGMMPPINRSMSVPDTGSMWDMHTSASQPSGGEASLWDLTMNSSTQGPTLEQLQKLQQERRDAELRAKREEEEQRKRREEKRRQQEEQKRREEEEIFRRKQVRLEEEVFKGNGCNVVFFSPSDSIVLNMHVLVLCSDQYMMRRKRTEEEEKLLKLLQGMKPQDGFTTWCEQMLHALNTSANNSSSSVDVATIVAYLKEVESPYAVLDFIRSYLGDTVEAKEFAKQFLERRAKQKANQQRQQQQVGLQSFSTAYFLVCDVLINNLQGSHALNLIIGYSLQPFSKTAVVVKFMQLFMKNQFIFVCGSVIFLKK